MKKVLIILMMFIPLFISACSCNNFNLKTYETAVKNFNNSTGFEYELTITKKVEGQEYYEKEYSKNKYLLTPTGEVYDFASELKHYRIGAPLNGPEEDPYLEYTTERYYVGEENMFYTKVVEGVREMKDKQYISYEEKYSNLNNQYNIKNLVPVFKKDQLTGFKISSFEDKDGYSTSLFSAPVPSFLESDEETTLYSVTINKKFYFYTIEYVVIDGSDTTTYEYKFLNYNSKVSIDFPADLVNYN